MALAIRDIYQGISSGWWVIDQDTGVKIEGNSYRNLKHAWIAHRKANELPWNDVEDWIQKQVCDREPSVCNEKDDRVDKPSKYSLSWLSIPGMIANLAVELARWTAAGYSTVDEETYKKRANTCMSCEHWDKRGFAGKGKCRVCGCSSVKLHISTSKCPKNFW